MTTHAFWREKTLAQMNPGEWESLCDGCGKCCMLKLEDEDTGEIHTTNVACKLLDRRSCRCKDYPNRVAKVPDCVQLTPDLAGELSWLPRTCAYRLVAEGRDLPAWHPLVTGDPETVHAAGVSIRGFAVSERSVRVRDLVHHIVALPGEGQATF